jgi:hypothetical protein
MAAISWKDGVELIATSGIPEKRRASMIFGSSLSWVGRS